MGLSRKTDLQAATLRVWKPFVQWLLQSGIGARGGVRLLKIAYALVGDELVGRVGASKKINAARVAAVTHLNRKEVRGLVREARGSRVLDRLGLQTRIQRVLWGWHNDRRFRNPDGTPRLLLLRGPTSFEELVRAHGGGLPVHTCLREFLKAKAVHRRRDGRLKVLRRTFATARMDSAGIAALAEALTERMTALLHNAKCPGRGSMYERRIVSVALDKDSADLLRVRIKDRAEAFGDGVEDEITDFSHAPKARSTQRKRPLVFTMFVSEADDDAGAGEGGSTGSSAQDLPPPPPAARASPTRARRGRKH